MKFWDKYDSTSLSPSHISLYCSLYRSISLETLFLVYVSGWFLVRCILWNLQRSFHVSFWQMCSCECFSSCVLEGISNRMFWYSGLELLPNLLNPKLILADYMFILAWVAFSRVYEEITESKSFYWVFCFVLFLLLCMEHDFSVYSLSGTKMHDCSKKKPSDWGKSDCSLGDTAICAWCIA